MKRSPIKRRPWRKALGTPDQRFAFRLGVLAADDFECVMKGRSGLGSAGCDGLIQAAHIVSKHKLRELGYGPDIVYSTDSAMCLCERHHNRHDRGLERVPYELLPERCRLFVARLGLLPLLERTYEEVRP